MPKKYHQYRKLDSSLTIKSVDGMGYAWQKYTVLLLVWKTSVMGKLFASVCARAVCF